MRYYLLRQYQKIDNPITLPTKKEAEQIVTEHKISYCMDWWLMGN